MVTRKSFFIRAEGPDQQAVKQAFRWLVTNATDRAFLAVMGYDNLRGVIRDIFGDRTVETFIKEGRLRVDGIEIYLVTQRKMIDNGEGAPLVVFYPTTKFLDQIDSISNVPAMLVVPWLMKAIEPWIKTWSATELGTQESREEPELIKNKVVVEALKSLTALVNVSTGITHPSDREAAIQLFTILRDAGEFFNPENVKAWLIRYGGWKAQQAQEVAELAQKILDRRRLRKGRRILKENILEILREKAERTESEN